MQMTNIEEENSDSLKSSMIESDESHHHKKHKKQSPRSPTEESKEETLSERGIEQ